MTRGQNINCGGTRDFNRRSSPSKASSRTRSCPSCLQAGRADYHNHFLSKCRFLPDNDKQFLTKCRHIAGSALDSEVFDPVYKVSDLECTYDHVDTQCKQTHVTTDHG